MEEKNFESYKSTVRKIMCVGWLHRNVFERNISKMGIHHSQHYLLVYIAKNGEIASQKTIADQLGITPAAVARSLKALEAEGYIERLNIPDDSRYKKIVITEKGKEIVEKSHRMFKETDEGIFKDFSEEDMARFNEYLDRMYARLLEKNEENCCVRKENEKEE
jgi:DNA-binding MarR family transcriptional regulator